MSGRTYSSTELSCYRRCPREHHYRYVLRRSPMTVGEALSAGKRMHDALAAHHMGAPWSLDAPLERALMAGYVVRWADSEFRIEAVNVPFRCSIGGVDMVGELDGVGVDQTGRKFIIEHKTSSEDISPGSSYWRRVVSGDAQVSTYLYAARALGMHADHILYDVLRKLPLRGKAGEAAEALEIRALEAIAERPEHYYQRAHIVRMPAEHAAHEQDIAGTVHLLLATKKPGPRNTDSCMKFGRACDFMAVCFDGASIDDPERFCEKTSHSREIVARVSEQKGYVF